MFQDAADPARYTECFMNESWVEHLRQHERVTQADREVQLQVESFHIAGERPCASHLIAAHHHNRG
ncbi:MAG TPA: MFS transporter [Burkholderiales bacterium]|nr:MFS transporter [Burkholderiales bacterium]